MNQKFKNLFIQVLQETDEIDPKEAFEGSLDDGTEPDAFDVDGDNSMVDALCVELRSDVEKLTKVISYLVDPDNPKCMLKRLEKVHKTPEFDKLFAPIEKAIEKTAESLATAVQKINVAVTTGPGKRDKRRQEDVTKQSTSSAPY